MFDVFPQKQCFIRTRAETESRVVKKRKSTEGLREKTKG